MSNQPMKQFHRIGHAVSFIILMGISVALVSISYEQHDWNHKVLTLNAVLSNASGVKLDFNNSVLLNGIPMLGLAAIGIFFSYRGWSNAVNSVYIAFFIYNLPSILMTVAQQKYLKIYSWAYLDAINQTLSGRSLDVTLQYLQERHQCCGWWSPADYNSTRVMASCCALPRHTLTPRSTCNSTDIVYHRGCCEAIHFAELPHYLTVALALVIAVTVLSCLFPIGVEFGLVFVETRQAKHYQTI